jgi:basic membrane protein A
MAADTPTRQESERMRSLIALALAATAFAVPLAAPAARASERPVALIIAQGGLGDGSWNDTAFAGFKAGLAATGLNGRPIESPDVAAQGEDMMRRAAEAGFGLVMSLEWIHGEAMVEVARDFPDVNWVIYNQERPGKNIASVLFAEHEGSYLAGMLAALVTTEAGIAGINPDPVIGVIGAVKAPGIDKFIAGFMEGAAAANPAVQVLVAYSETFGDPALGAQMARAMFEQGADIIYHVAGGTGLGVIQAAQAAGRYAIGVDTDQDGLAPGHVLTSMVKRVDLATQQLIEAYAAGTFPGGQTLNLDLAANGVGLSAMTHTRALIPQAILDRVEAARRSIVAGEIAVWDVTTQGYPAFFAR